MTTQQLFLCRRPWLQAVVFGVPLAMFLLYAWYSQTAKVLDYGKPGSVWIKPSEVSIGQEAQFCFSEVTWHRICKSNFHYSIAWKDPKGVDHSVDGTHPVSFPDRPQKLPPKCRPWKVPELPAGNLTIRAWSTSECALPIIGPVLAIRAEVPPVSLIVRP